MVVWSGSYSRLIRLDVFVYDFLGLLMGHGAGLMIDGDGVLGVSRRNFEDGQSSGFY